MTYRAADALADTLLRHGVDRAFGVPGESFLAALDALLDRPRIDLVTCRHEGAAALAAVADARLTGKPAVLFVSRGPGMSNASIGLHVAQQDALPLVVFVGQVDRPLLGRHAFQEVDYRRMFGGVAKDVLEVQLAARMGQIIAQAFATARSGTPRPIWCWPSVPGWATPHRRVSRFHASTTSPRHWYTSTRTRRHWQSSTTPHWRSCQAPPLWCVP